MSSNSHASRRHPSGGTSTTTTVLAAKVAVASAALAGAASVARLAVPQLVSVAGAVFPRAWAVARFWLAPPYLFVTVHLIILVIWKLSDHNKHLQAQQPHHKDDDPWPAVALDEAAGALAAVKAKQEEFGGAGRHVVEPGYSSPDSSSGGGDSCVTTESDEDASSSAPTSYYSAEARRSVAPVQERERCSLSSSSSLQTQTVERDDDDDDLDATWNAIMQKTRSAPAPPSPPAPRARDPSVGAEEMNRRFDDFIKKNRNSFGRR